jgi:hypothetical protein
MDDIDVDLWDDKGLYEKLSRVRGFQPRLCCRGLLGLRSVRVSPPSPLIVPLNRKTNSLQRMKLAAGRLMWLSLTWRRSSTDKPCRKVGLLPKPEMWGRGLISKRCCFGSQKRFSSPAPALLLTIGRRPITIAGIYRSHRHLNCYLCIRIPNPNPSQFFDSAEAEENSDSSHPPASHTLPNGGSSARCGRLHQQPSPTLQWGYDALGCNAS